MGLVGVTRDQSLAAVDESLALEDENLDDRSPGEHYEMVLASLVN